MHKELEKLLSKIDKKIVNLEEKEVQKEFGKIPLDIFGRIQIDRPPEYPNILYWLPHMPSPEIQSTYNGCADHKLMNQSIAFIKSIVSTYHAKSYKPLRQSKVLDFGCGWGRIIRLLYKYVPADFIYGVDPSSKIINICKETNVHAKVFLSDYLPRSLPTPKNLKFDFIMAFSVFTHLSEKVTKICAKTLSNYLTDTGILAITIRPEEFWPFILDRNESFSRKDISKLLADHNQKGFAFYPDNRTILQGEATYGDTSMSLDFIRHNFADLDIVGVELNDVDRFQLIVFLTKSTK